MWQLVVEFVENRLEVKMSEEIHRLDSKQSLEGGNLESENLFAVVVSLGVPLTRLKGDTNENFSSVYPLLVVLEDFAQVLANNRDLVLESYNSGLNLLDSDLCDENMLLLIQLAQTSSKVGQYDA